MSRSVWRMVRRTRLAALMSPVVVHWVNVLTYPARSLARVALALKEGAILCRTAGCGEDGDPIRCYHEAEE
jgi:hypothetical protein